MTKGEHRFLKSDRLYYNARLIPVSAITAGTAGQVLDFVVERLPEVQALFTPKEASAVGIAEARSLMSPITDR